MINRPVTVITWKGPDTCDRTHCAHIQVKVRICLCDVRNFTLLLAAKRVQSCRVQRGEKVIRDSMKMSSLCAIIFVTLMGTSLASENTNKKGKACFCNYKTSVLFSHGVSWQQRIRVSYCIPANK